MKKKSEERRIFAIRDLETRAATDDEPAVIRGYAAVFNQLSEPLWGFRELIRPGAFRQSIDENDVRALWNHNSDFVLGRNQAGTLLLDEDEQGLRVVIMPPETQWANDLIVSMQRGDVDQMSFGFVAREDVWKMEAGEKVRELVEVDLFDVSIVTYPAYPQTSAEVRNVASALAAGAGGQANELAGGGAQGRANEFRLKLAEVEL